MPYFSSRTCWWHCPRCPWHLRDQSDLSVKEFLLSGGRGLQSCEFSEREQIKFSRWRHYHSRLPQWPLGTARAPSWAAPPPEDIQGSWSSRSASPLCPESIASPKVDFIRRVYFLLGEEFNSVVTEKFNFPNSFSLSAHLVGVCLEGGELDALLKLDPPDCGVVLHVHSSLLKRQVSWGIYGP